MSELHLLSEFCAFGATLNSILRDHLVYGILDNYIQMRLLDEPNLTFPRTMELAQGLNAATSNVCRKHSSEQAEALLPGEIR